MAGDVKESSATALPVPVDGMGSESDPLQPVTEATKAGSEASKALLRFLRMEGCEIIRLDAGAAPALQSQYVRFRVRYVIVSAVTASTMTLTIGTATYPFEGQARGNDVVPFPLVIERGSDMSCAGVDGRLYLIGDPE